MSNTVYNNMHAALTHYLEVGVQLAEGGVAARHLMANRWLVGGVRWLIGG